MDIRSNFLTMLFGAVPSIVFLFYFPMWIWKHINIPSDLTLFTHGFVALTVGFICLALFRQRKDDMKYAAQLSCYSVIFVALFATGMLEG